MTAMCQRYFYLIVIAAFGLAITGAIAQDQPLPHAPKAERVSSGSAAGS
jgi:hypothetical protein